MKILRLSFENINSLKGRHSVDFTEPPFSSSSLFAITGPTGSGKSSLLDVISLALFNQVPRLGKISKNEILNKGAILTRNQKSAFAKVTYFCSRGTFTSHWSISTNRNNKLRDYDMEIADGSGAILDFKKSQVPEQNERLIGLNYEQFIKSVVLAQGEFSRFLKAKKDERGELLEKITGTGIYRELGKRAYERFKNEQRGIEKQYDKIQMHESELLEASEFEAIDTKFRQVEKDMARLEPEIATLKKRIELKDLIAKQINEINEEEAKKKKASKALAEFEKESGAKLNRHEKLRPIAEALRSWTSLQDMLKQLEARKGKHLDMLNRNDAALELSLQEISIFIGAKIPSEKVEDSLADFTKQIHALQQSRNQKLADLERLESIIKEQAKETPFLYKRFADHLQLLNTLKDDSEKRIARLAKINQIAVAEDLEERLEQLKREIQSSKELEKNEQAQERERKLLKEYISEERGLAERAEALPKEIKVADTQAKFFAMSAEKHRLAVEVEKLRASLDELRSDLEENKPCPLCGSLEHPYAEHLPKTLGENDKLYELKAEREKWNDEATAKKTELAGLKKRQIEIGDRIATTGRTLDRLLKIEKELILSTGAKSSGSWQKHTAKLQQASEAITEILKEQKTISSIDEIVPNVKLIKTTIADGKKIKKRLTEKYGGNDIDKDTQMLLKQWTALKEENKSLNHGLEEMQKEIGEKFVEKEDLEAALQKSDILVDFEDILDARSSLLDEKAFSELQAKKSQFNSTLERSKSAWEILRKQLASAQALDIEEEAEKLRERLEMERSALVTLQNQRKALDRKLVNHREKLEKIATIRVQIVEEEKRIKPWKLLNELIGDAQGKRFNDFAQDLTLRHLLVLANIRLADLSERYRLDTPQGGEDDGLIAIDEHMGGQRRSVKTLSGGETFLISLSMALALSDLASRNVEIDSLFIDEGFGTLDPETLDQTLDTLERLQTESSKMIGIISHVDSLKERIATQIRLERNGQGYSTFSIV